jgi:hypothetical protein
MGSTRSCDGCVMAAIRRLKAFLFRRRSPSSTASSLRGPDGKAVSIVCTSSLPYPREIFPDGCDVTDHLLKGSPTNFRREDITLGTDVDGCVLSHFSLPPRSSEVCKKLYILMTPGTGTQYWSSKLAKTQWKSTKHRRLRG